VYRMVHLGWIGNVFLGLLNESVVEVVPAGYSGVDVDRYHPLAGIAKPPGKAPSLPGPPGLEIDVFLQHFRAARIFSGYIERPVTFLVRPSKCLRSDADHHIAFHLHPDSISADERCSWIAGQQLGVIITVDAHCIVGIQLELLPISRGDRILVFQECPDGFLEKCHREIIGIMDQYPGRLFDDWSHRRV